MKSLDRIEAHGAAGLQHPEWGTPKCVARSDKPVRADQGNYARADEFEDGPADLDAKLEVLARLLRSSRHTTVYSGAGISRASGIADYASRAENSRSGGGAASGQLRSPLHAKPTLSHRVLAALFGAGLAHDWVQQNHDGLPQKAGVGEHVVNDIHGSWWDVSNPVVQFNESLRGDLFQRLLDTEQRSDLTLVLGTSLSGMNADRCAVTPAEKMATGDALGTVIINLQRTHLDSQSALRIWCTLDRAFELLARKMGLEVPAAPFERRLPAQQPSDVFLVPYGADGSLDRGVLQRLDLSVGAQLQIANPEASNAGQRCEVIAKDEWGNWVVRMLEGTFRQHCLGRWWRETLTEGRVPHLPLQQWPTPAVERLGPLTVHYRHTRIAERCHEWEVRVEGAGIKSVTFQLHPTFSPATVRVSEAPWSVTRRGWGTFEVPFAVELLDGSVKEDAIELDFSVETTKRAL